MRLMPSFHLSYPDARGVRTALAAGAVAGLVTLAACTDSNTSPKSLSAPAGPRNATTSSGTQGHGSGYAATVRICVDASSPAGTYTFKNSGWNSGIAIAAGSWKGVNWNIGGYDPGDGGEGLAPNDGSRVFSPAEGVTTPYTVGVGSCVTVLERTNPSAHYNGVDPVWGFGPDFQDDFQAVNVEVNSIPGGAVYDHTDCVMDVGVVEPQPNPCGSNSQKVRGFTNYDHGTQITFVFKSQPVLAECTLGYPDNSNLPKSGVAFNESEVLRGFAITPGKINAIYSDEHALTLGVDVNFTNNKNPTPDVTATFPIALMSSNMTGTKTAAVTGSPVLYGSTITSGTFAAVDGAGRPLFPALFVTDLTTNGAASRAGDWQQGGTPIAPNALYGTWKGAKITLDNTKNPAVVSVTPNADPQGNGTNFGPGAPVGVYPAGLSSQGWSTDVVWNISSIPGYDASHSYRAQFMVHDGDQNKTGGDVGQACVNIVPGG
jgi:hypothetical protein